MLNQQNSPTLVMVASPPACHTVAIKQTRNTAEDGKMKIPKESGRKHSRSVYRMLLETVFGIRETANDRYMDIRTGRKLSEEQVLDIMSKF